MEVSRRSAPHSRTPGVYVGLTSRRVSSPARTKLHDNDSTVAASRARSVGQAPSKCAEDPSPRSCPKRADAAACFEPLSEPASAAAAPAAHRGRSEPLVEPATEPGVEPLVDEDTACGADRCKDGDGGGRKQLESPRSRISRLEEANIRSAAKQTVDGLLVQFQQQGFVDPRDAAHQCLQVSLELLGAPARGSRMPTVPKDSPHLQQTPPVLVGPDEFKNPSSFLRIYGDPLAAAAPKRGGYQPESHQDGNWRCDECGNVNFPRRQRCNKCHVVRGPGGDAVVLGYAMRVYEVLLKSRACD